MPRTETDFSEVIGSLYRATKGKGILLTAVGHAGKPNAMTLGWGLFGWYYHGRPVVVVAVRPACHTFSLLDEVEELVLSIPAPDIEKAVLFCGTRSGRDCDKFAETGLTPVPSVNVKPPSILECPVNIECRIYHKQRPPHFLLTPEHRERPLEAQHTIYFAEVLGTYRFRQDRTEPGELSQPGQGS